MMADNHPLPAIPVVDLSCLLADTPQPQQLSQLASSIRAACRDVGFLYITGHGIPAHQLSKGLGLVDQLFDLLAEAKEEVDAAKSPLSRGYNSYLHGRHSCTPEDGERDLKESFTVGVERAPGDPRPPSPMHGPNLWPSAAALPGWREAVEGVFASLLAAARLLMRGLALSLDMPQDFFTQQCDDPVAQMVMFRYPPSQSERDRGCGAHTDCGFLTLVVQSQPGIEVLCKDGQWVAAPPLDGALLVNLGDMAARWTNDEYKSTVHRVVNRGSSSRTSLVFFCNCNFNAQVACIPTLPGPAKYSPTKAGEYILQKLGLMYN